MRQNKKKSPQKYTSSQKPRHHRITQAGKGFGRSLVQHGVGCGHGLERAQPRGAAAVLCNSGRNLTFTSFSPESRYTPRLGTLGLHGFSWHPLLMGCRTRAVPSHGGTGLASSPPAAEAAVSYGRSPGRCSQPVYADIHQPPRRRTQINAVSPAPPHKYAALLSPLRDLGAPNPWGHTSPTPQQCQGCSTAPPHPLGCVLPRGWILLTLPPAPAPRRRQAAESRRESGTRD